MPVGEANLFGLHQFDYRTSFFSVDPVFSKGVGYATLVGLGTVFAVLAILVFYLDQKYAGSDYHSEEFNTAGRSIKTGMIAVDVVSHWTWVASLLQSTVLVYQYGVSAALWYANASVIQIFVFGAFAVQLKRRAPKAHTFTELVRLRWGHSAGFVFFYLSYLNNTLVTALMIIGSANIFVAATGMNIYAALILIPLSIVVYIVVGGLKATFVSSYLHTVVIFVGLNILVYAVYVSGTFPIRNLSEMWHNLNTYATVVPVKGNKDGSYMTLFSTQGIVFGVFNLFAVFGSLFPDQTYWQSAIAASPIASFRGYILGGLVWIPIPLALSTALGWAALASDLPISSEETDAGLVALASAEFLLGKGGVVLIMLMVFMAATSTGSGELIAMSSLFTYDVYKVEAFYPAAVLQFCMSCLKYQHAEVDGAMPVLTNHVCLAMVEILTASMHTFQAYIRRQANGAELLIVSRISVVVLGILMAAVSCIFYKIGLNVNFLFLVVGLMVSSSVPPLAFLLTWPSVPKGAAIGGAIGGQIGGVTAWLVHTKVVYRIISITSLQQLAPTTVGTVVSTLLSALICISWTLLFPDRDDSFSRFEGIELMDNVTVVDHEKEDPTTMTRFLKESLTVSILLTVVVVVAWPLFTLPAGVFSKGYFTFFVVLTIIWAAVATLICIFTPLLESSDILIKVVRLLLGLHVHDNLKASNPGLLIPDGTRSP